MADVPLFVFVSSIMMCCIQTADHLFIAKGSIAPQNAYATSNLQADQ